MIYGIGNNELARKNLKGQVIPDLVGHSQHVAKTYTKKVVWVFVFNTPFDLQKCVRIIESVTKPQSEDAFGKENVERQIDAALEDRRLDYMKRNNLNFGQESKPEVINTVGGKRYQVSEIVNNAELSR